MRHIVYNTTNIVYNTRSNQATPSSSFGWLEWALLLLSVPWSSFGCDWLDAGVCKPCIDSRTLKWMTWKIQMIWNISELQKATRSEVVVGEAGTAAFEDLGAAPFAIHIEMQWISFESIAKCSIANEIIKWTNLKDHLLLSEGLSIELILLPHCFVPPPHFFVPLPETP
jgi:hypothetical protein